MSKKFYFVLSPCNKEDELKNKAASYYGSKEYQDILTSSEFIDKMKEGISNQADQFNVHLMLIGTSLVAMSLSDSIYVSKDWESDDYCKFCHTIAFAHGLDIVYEL